MDINEYMKSRVDDQIEWYDKKSVKCQRWYKFLQAIEIIIAASIPVLSGYTSQCFTITIIESLTKLYKHHENWIEYRTTCELLRYQKYLYITKSAPYNDEPESIDNIFVRNIENIISSENNKWKNINIKEAAENKSAN